MKLKTFQRALNPLKSNLINSSDFLLILQYRAIFKASLCGEKSTKRRSNICFANFAGRNSNCQCKLLLAPTYVTFALSLPFQPISSLYDSVTECLTFSFTASLHFKWRRRSENENCFKSFGNELCIRIAIAWYIFTHVYYMYYISCYVYYMYIRRIMYSINVLCLQLMWCIAFLSYSSNAAYRSKWALMDTHHWTLSPTRKKQKKTISDFTIKKG